MVKKTEAETTLQKLKHSVAPPLLLVIGFYIFLMVLSNRFDYSASPYPRIERGIAIYGSIFLVSIALFLGSPNLRKGLIFGGGCFLFISLSFILVKGPTMDAGAISFTGEDIILYAQAFKILFPLGVCAFSIGVIYFMIEQGKLITGIAMVVAAAVSTWFFFQYIVI